MTAYKSSFEFNSFSFSSITDSVSSITRKTALSNLTSSKDCLLLIGEDKNEYLLAKLSDNYNYQSSLMFGYLILKFLANLSSLSMRYPIRVVNTIVSKLLLVHRPGIVSSYMMNIDEWTVKYPFILILFCFRNA